ncbi:TPA: ead/Ea22-like family protein [Escherichia coli]|nr:ead/Ea22-like family protein [Escherichia coli]HEA5213475.1 ead/Ea22-like family protein [Escherichia coli]
MSKIDYQALRAKAEKATCGVWSLEYGEGRFDGDDALIHREVAGYIPICRIEGAHPESGFDEDFQMEQQANAEFIAAANPATVLALLGELETAENNLIDSECHVAELEEALRDKQALLEAAEKRIAELEAREISLPERSSMLHRTDFHDDYQTVMAYKVSEVIDAIRAAGIRIKGE